MRKHQRRKVALELALSKLNPEATLAEHVLRLATCYEHYIKTGKIL